MDIVSCNIGTIRTPFFLITASIKNAFDIILIPFFEEIVQISGLSPRNSFYRSASPEKRDTSSHGNITREADRYLVSIDYDRNLRLPFGVSEHFLKFLRVFIYVDIDGPVPVGCPSLGAIWSSIRAVNDDLVHHDRLLRSAAD